VPKCHHDEERFGTKRGTAARRDQSRPADSSPIGGCRVEDGAHLPATRRHATLSLIRQIRPPLGLGRDVPQVRGAHGATLPGMESITLDIGLALGAVVTILAAVVGTGVALASQSRADRAAADANRQADRAAADADRQADRASADADRRAFQTEMLRLAERQSHVEGRLDERGAVAD